MKDVLCDPLAWIDAELAELANEGLLRQRAAYLAHQAPTLEIDGQSLTNFAANDYLGLATDPRVTQAASAAALADGAGAGASPLVTGRRPLHAQLEAALAAFEGTEAALLFPTGFAANLGTIAALVGRGDVIYSDALNHASLIDGCRLSRAQVRIYPHADSEALGAMLARDQPTGRRLIVTDALFSMDGDFAPLPALVELAEQQGAMLLVDEAHATGVFGARGRGVAEQLGVDDRVHVRVGTLSKSLGAAGGFVVGSRALIEWLTNRARPYVFSTALAPAAAGAALAALEIIAHEAKRRDGLLTTAGAVRDELARQGWNIGATTSQIIPLVVGGAAEAVALSSELRAAGLLVPAIRPPTVPEGASRLRISLSAAHTPAMIAHLLATLARLRSKVS